MTFALILTIGVCAILVALLAGGLVARAFSDLRFSDREMFDKKSGYPPVMLLMLVAFLFVAAVVCVGVVTYLNRPVESETSVMQLLQERLPTPKEQNTRQGDILRAIASRNGHGGASTAPDLDKVLGKYLPDRAERLSERQELIRAMSRASPDRSRGGSVWWPLVSMVVCACLTLGVLFAPRAPRALKWGAALFGTITFTLSSIAEFKDLTLFRHEGALFEFKYVLGPSGVSEGSAVIATPQLARALDKSAQPVVPRCDTDASHTLEGFGDGDAWVSPPQTTALWKIVDGFRSMKAQTPSRRLVSIVLTGSVDKRGLRDRSRRIYRTNAGLAYARAANTGAVFLDRLGSRIEVDIVNDIAARLLDDHSSSKLAPERSVTICPVWAEKP